MQRKCLESKGYSESIVSERLHQKSDLEVRKCGKTCKRGPAWFCDVSNGENVNFSPRYSLIWIYTCVLLIDKVVLRGERCLSEQHLKNSFELFSSRVALVERVLKTLKDLY